MQITFTRQDRDGRYVTHIRRDDGVAYVVRGVGHTFEMPHDLAHLVIERALGLTTGFWGSVSDGAVFPTMTYEGGRRKPKAAQRSKDVLKANARRLVEAEVLVSVFSDTIVQGHAETSPILRYRPHERLPARERDIWPGHVSEIYAAYASALRDWSALRPGEAMRLDWDVGSRRRR
ncbi:hypothetical protein [Bradyrhizobium liaoningense]|uniref:hypothetical protein n=1 Tax=Bradyrhizobium liaoningense TaxID=43992 RepID=UPI001BAAA6C9|nr:hypothetical protein [Bradyrhizobium liaoningense]MBR0718931.1 hypothetical protein [Bradyrhizobium liaoningense]